MRYRCPGEALSHHTRPGAARRRALVMGMALVMGIAALPALADSVDRMSCAQAVRVVQSTNGYEKKTGFGTVPIQPVYPVGKTGAFCPGRLYPAFSVEKTLDNPACVLGFTCERRERR